MDLRAAFAALSALWAALLDVRTPQMVTANPTNETTTPTTQQCRPVIPDHFGECVQHESSLRRSEIRRSLSVPQSRKLRALIQRSKASIQRPDQFIDVVLRGIEHHAGADNVAVQTAFADQHATLFGFFENPQH